jgi:hypothetical protein
VRAGFPIPRSTPTQNSNKEKLTPRAVLVVYIDGDIEVTQPRQRTMEQSGTKRSTSKRTRSKQGMLDFKEWGGFREGAGRKRASPRPRVTHAARPRLSRHVPVHVTLRLAPGLPTLRQGRSHHALLRSLGAAADRQGLRILHYSAQSNHVHLICEAEDARSLSRGMQGLCVRIAQALNRLWKRCGSFFADRYHCRQLKTPTEVRNTLKYVLLNAAHHGIRLLGGIDSFSSGSWFDGWSRPTGTLHLALRSCPFPPARSFLMTKGWRKHGLIDRPS